MQGQCAIIMFDAKRRMTYNYIAKWYKDLVNVCEKIPIALIGNKGYSEHKEIIQKSMTLHKKLNIPVALYNYNKIY